MITRWGLPKLDVGGSNPLARYSFPLNHLDRFRVGMMSSSHGWTLPIAADKRKMGDVGTLLRQSAESGRPAMTSLRASRTLSRFRLPAFDRVFAD
jgi:hypothetical protein